MVMRHGRAKFAKEKWWRSVANQQRGKWIETGVEEGIPVSRRSVAPNTQIVVMGRESLRSRFKVAGGRVVEIGEGLVLRKASQRGGHIGYEKLDARATRVKDDRVCR
ncbi:hypothetical protein NDU88_010685 [Pleurodeles waltl]|uniref:Uncharacterized protein n=1 Tax=Pleurodeles waltl TaxID=8319 RepID=A0AAV7S0C9_PLEWA|nr:hypothetical protein NDU88_010685 [Pleurodeles waltl]